jgi:hypothetical protein
MSMRKKHNSRTSWCDYYVTSSELDFAHKEWFNPSDQIRYKIRSCVRGLLSYYIIWLIFAQYT